LKDTWTNLVNVGFSLSAMASLCFGITATSTLRVFRERRMAPSRNGQHQGIA
jgi:hypothetical protein